MKTRATVAREPNRPLEIDEIDLEGPKDGKVLIRIITTCLRHTDMFTLSGRDLEGLFPAILGHEGVDMTNGGVDYSLECIGNVGVMRSALECCRGWGSAGGSHRRLDQP